MVRGEQGLNGSLFSYVLMEDQIPANHPLRQIRLLANEVLKHLKSRFDRLCASTVCRSIPPEQLLLQAVYGLRSERLLLK